jgi:glycosyltransferase involved in cell wall biosynthesis
MALSGKAGSELASLIEEPLKLVQPRPSKIRPARFRGLHTAWRRFGGLGKRLRKWEDSNVSAVQLVFFACIFDHDFEHFKRMEKRFGFPWSGLYMHARSFRIPGSPMPYTGVMPCPEKVFTSKSLHSVALLDEGAVEPMRRIVGEKPIVWMPDFTDVYLPESSEGTSGLAKKITSFAQGRPVVSLMGFLVKTKGLEDFTAAIEAESMNDVFFFIGGEVRWGDIDDSTRQKMQKVWESAENVYAHLQFISSDTEMNAVIKASDVIFAVYRDFPNSSNILTKAAVFKKPIIVSDGYVMAERVREFGLGEVVEEGDVGGIAETLKRMLSDEYSGEMQSRARWEDFQSLHSADQLPKCFSELLGMADCQNGR